MSFLFHWFLLSFKFTLCHFHELALFFHPFTFNLPVMLYMKWDSWIWVEFINPLANTRLLSDVFMPFAFNLVTDMLEFLFHCIFYFLVLLFLFYLSFISFLSSCGLQEQFFRILLWFMYSAFELIALSPFVVFLLGIIYMTYHSLWVSVFYQFKWSLEVYLPLNSFILLTIILNISTVFIYNYFRQC